jgi:hypothetical protein
MLIAERPVSVFPAPIIDRSHCAGKSGLGRHLPNHVRAYRSAAPGRTRFAAGRSPTRCGRDRRESWEPRWWVRSSRDADRSRRTGRSACRRRSRRSRPAGSRYRRYRGPAEPMHFIKKIYRRVIDADECDSRIKPEPETFVIRISHGSDSISVTVPDGRCPRKKLLGDPGVIR